MSALPPTRRGRKWSDEDTDDPLIADHRNFCKVELWTEDEQRIERMLFGGCDLDNARAIFADFARKRSADAVDHPAEDAGAAAVAAPGKARDI